jgi:AAA ATPase domain
MRLLERDAQLEALHRALARARRGQGTTVLVVGEAGIGKTWLLQALAEQVGDSARVLAGTCEDLLTPRALVASYGARLLPEYRFDPRSGLWRHRDAPAPPVGLAGIRYDADGRLRHPGAPPRRVPERALAGHLAQARAILATPGHGATASSPPAPLPDRLERLHWFELPAACLDAPSTHQARLPGPHGQHGRGGGAALGEAFQGQPGVEERLQQLGEGAVGGADPGPDALVGPGGPGPVAVEVAGGDHHGVGVAAVGEPATEAGVHADVDQHPAGA